MEIKLITENLKEGWNNFVVSSSSPASFLQSWEWGSFRSEKLNEKIFRFGIYENNKLISVALFIKRALPNNKYYLNCPKGPIIKFSIFNFQFSNKSQKLNFKFQKEIYSLLIKKIKEISFKENVIFIRVAPPYEKKDEELDPGFKKPKLLTNLKEPESTSILGLSKSEEELLKVMHQKTRYNIRLSEKKGVVIKQEKNVDVLYNLLEETAKRDKINIFSKQYYQNLLDSNLNITQFIAYHENQPLSSIIIVGYGDTATYFYGASSDEKRNLMPNYLIQWKVIQWAKENGFKYYDFWGISADKGSWGGITKFKKGFTGQEMNFMGTFDYVLNKKWYNIFRIGKLIRNII